MQNLKNKVSAIVLFLPVCVTLIVNPISNYDPINPIKVLILSTFSFYIFGILLVELKSKTMKVNWLTQLGTTLFIIFMIVTLFFSGAPMQQQIWGSFGRNTGFVTYISLIFVLLACSFVSNIIIMEKITKSLIVTSVITTIYCLIQIMGLDPVRWSSFDTFATLGNINFLSAFLGLSSVAMTTLVFFSKDSIKIKVGLLFLTFVQLGIINSTGSIQGLMMWVAGFGIILFFYIRKLRFFKVILVPYFFISITAVFLTSIGLVNKGPFAKILYQPSVTFRGDYMHAGWAMTLLKPLTGVGLDSYGDWYRQLRGSISTNRTSPDRISNTAHNIYLDISSNGGFPLLTAYLILVFGALISAYQHLKNNKNPNPYFVAIFIAWITYQIQAAISINQVGVGVWGWIFTGLLLGFTKNNDNNSIDSNVKPIKFKNRKSSGTKQLSPSQTLFGLFFGLIGFVLAVIPLRADAQWKSAFQTGNLVGMMKASELPGATAFHGEMTLDLAIRNNFGPQAQEIANKLIIKYPRDYMAWKATWAITKNSESDRQKALEVLRRLDPYNPEYK